MMKNKEQDKFYEQVRPYLWRHKDQNVSLNCILHHQVVIIIMNILLKDLDTNLGQIRIQHETIIQTYYSSIILPIIVPWFQCSFFLCLGAI